MRGYVRSAVKRCALFLSRRLEIFLPAVSDQSARQSPACGGRRVPAGSAASRSAVGSAGAADPFFGSLAFGATSAGFSRSSGLASCRARGWLTRCSFAARLRCHCFSFKISLMAQASSNGAMLVYNFLPVHCIVDFARLCFVDRENIHQILHICIAQSFQISKARFHQS